MQNELQGTGQENIDVLVYSMPLCMVVFEDVFGTKLGFSVIFCKCVFASKKLF